MIVCFGADTVKRKGNELCSENVFFFFGSYDRAKYNVESFWDSQIQSTIFVSNCLGF